MAEIKFDEHEEWRNRTNILGTPAITEGLFSTNASEFFLQEHEALRKEIDGTVIEYRTLERNVVFATGATWVWLYTQHALWWTFFLAFLIVAFGAYRAWGINLSFGIYKNYVRKTEIAFRSQGSPLGWENDHPATGTAKGAVTFWAVLCLLTLTVPFLVRCLPASARDSSGSGYHSEYHYSYR